MPFAIVIGIAAGIVIGETLHWGVFFAATAALVGCILFVFALLRYSRPHLVVGICMIATAIALMRVDSLPEVRTALFDSLLNKKVLIEGRIASEPDEHTKTTSVLVDVVAINNIKTRKTKVLVQFPMFAPVAYGDTVSVEGKIELPENFSTGSHTFNYVDYLEKDAIGYTMSFASLKSSAPRQEFSFFSLAFAIKNICERGINAALGEPEAGLARGMLLGDKRALGTELYERFVETGLVHIVVLSGFNITLIAAALSIMLRGLDRRFKMIAVIVMAVFFSIITGFAASSMRAAIMAVLLTLSEVTKRSYEVTRALWIAVALFLLWSPLSLLYDPGLHLTLLATLGLIYISPLLEALFTRLPDMIRELSASTLAAYVATLPFLVFQMGTLSIVAIPANLLVLPVVAYASALAAVAGVVGVINDTLAPIIGFPAHVLLAYIIGVVETLSAVPFAQVTVPELPPITIVAAYGCLALFVFVLQTKTASEREAVKNHKS